jgi:hypothetical protein
MKSLWNQRFHDTIVSRGASLSPDLQPRWGRMTCAQMVVHVTDAFAMYCGDLAVAARHTPIEYFPLKHAFLYMIPMPRNVPTARELKLRVAGDWEAEMSRLRYAIERFESRRGRADWPLHPIFGQMSEHAYGVLAYKHTDHHLRQFGV